MSAGRRDASAPGSAAAPPWRGLLLLTVAFTNLVSLACQVIWLRKLAFLFGSTATVFSAVVATFLLGLAGGAWIAGHLADRPIARQALAAVEVAIGLCALGSLPLFDALRALYLALAPADLEPLPAALAKLLVVMVSVLPPTLAIGAVFPLAVALYGGDSRRPGSELAIVYGVDTVGAAAGALLAGFLLVPRLGLAASTHLLGGAALVLAVVLFAGGRRSRGDGTPRASRGRGAPRAAAAAVDTRATAPETSPAVPLLPLLAAFFLSGAAALALETGWNRYFGLLDGTHVYATSAVLTGFLVGIGSGSLLMQRLSARLAEPAGAVAVLFGLIVLGGAAVFRSEGPFARAYMALFEAGGGYYRFQLTVAALIALLVALATLPMGANFPLVAALTRQGPGDQGRAAGRAFAANTGGAVLGALASELLLLPRGGFSALLLATALAYALAAAIFVALVRPGKRRRYAVASALLFLFALPLLPLRAPLRVRHAGLYYHGLRAGSWRAYRAEQSKLQPLERRQGLYGEVAVHAFDGDLLLKINGKTDASTNAKDNRTQLLLGHLPMAFHPAPRRVLQIGLGAGLTLRALERYREAENITVAELDPLVVSAARRRFATANGHALEDPRVRVVTNDGRNLVDSSEGGWDVISSEPPNIWVAGVSGLFTREFYRSVDRHLLPGGILCQWVPLYEMEREDFRTMLHTLGGVFPQVAVWQVGGDVVLLASKGTLRAEPEMVAARARRPEVAADLAAVGLSPEAFVELVSSPEVAPSSLGAYLGTEPAGTNTDDLPVLEFSTARHLFELGGNK